MKQKLLLFLFALSWLIPLRVSARDFTYTNEGQTITYTVIDEEAKTCSTKVGSYYSAGNKVSGVLILPANPKDGDVEYSLTSVGQYAFRDCSGLSSIEIPNSVTSIGSRAFDGCSSLTSIEIPNSVESIGNYAFYGCSGLTSIAIPNSVTSIGSDAFYGCSGLTSVTIGNSVTSIGEYSFYGCGSLTSIEIPNSVTSIGDNTFYGCSSLTSVTIEDGETTLSLGYNNNKGLFSDCPLEKVYLGRNLSYYPSSYYWYSPFYKQEKLTSVTIGNSVTSIGDNTFYGCSSLTSVTIEDGETTLSLGYNNDNNKGLFYDCPLEKVYLGRNLSYDNSQYCGYSPFYRQKKLSEVTIGNSVTEIGKYAFYGCSRLTSIEIPNSVTSIGDNAFNGCSSLTSVRIEDSETTLSLGYNRSDKGLFSDCPLEKVYLGRNLSYVTSYDSYSPFYKQEKLTSVTIGNSVTSIGASAFRGCSGLTTVTIGNSVTSIGDYAFYGCSSLIPIEIPNSVTSIGDYAFWSCSGLTSVEIPNSVTKIGDNAFRGCSGLISVEIPNSVTKIGDNAFRGCSGLISVEIPNSVTSIGDFCFSGCSGLTSITIGNSVTSIGDNTFYGCSRLTSIEIPNSVTSIGDNAFTGCSGLKEVIFNAENCNQFNCIFPSTLEKASIGENVKTIPASLFSGCSNLTSIEIPNSVTSIGEDAFTGCSGLKEVIFNAENCNQFNCIFPSTLEKASIGENVKTIPASLFSGCSNLTSIEIPNSVTSIGESAFYGCSAITSIKLGNSLTSIAENAFGNCNKLVNITVSADNAPTISSVSFSEFSYDQAIVEVPAGSKSSYREKWSKFMHLFASDDKTSFEIYTINNPGDLLNLVSKNDIDVLRAVKIIGSINGTDILTLNKMVNLQKLDLSEATIVSGGLPYYEKDNVRFGTKDNTLGQNWAYNLTVLSEIELPVNLISIEEYAFAGKPHLEQIVITDSVISVGKSAFEGCSGLTSIVIPKSVTSIGSFAFSGCSGLTLVRVEDGKSALRLGYGFKDSDNNAAGQGLFYDCPLENLYLGRNIAYDNSKECGYSPFYKREKLSNIALGDSVTLISKNAFSGCCGLTTVVIPDSITIIGSSAFENCSSLTSIKIPNLVTEINSSAFKGCSGLTSIEIPNSVTSIGEYCFSGCCGLTTVVIPDSITIIGSSAFENCSSLTSIKIPNLVTEINSSAFKGCSGLTKAEFTSLQSLCSITFANSTSNPLSYAHNLYIDGEEITEVVIPEHINSIGNYAFYSCKGLNSIYVPNSINEIGESSLGECTSLTSVIIEDGETTLSIGNSSSHRGLFFDCPLATLYLGRDLSYDSSYNSGYSPFYGQGKLIDITISNCVTKLGNSVFSGCSGLTSIEIPNSVTSIGNCAFNNCISLSSVTLEDGMNTLELGYNFDGYKGLGDGLFYDCPLEKLYLGRNVSYQNSKRYGYSPFYEQEKLSTLIIGDSVTSISKYIFEGCSSLTSISIPNSVISISSSAFSGCSSLTSVRIEDSKIALSLGSNATWIFSNCPLENLYLGRNLSYDSSSGSGYSPFSEKEKLTNVTIGKLVTIISPSAFNGCIGITAIEIPDSVTYIGSSAFKDCGGLTSIEIPNSVYYIGSSAFDGCSALTVVTLGNSVESIGHEAFADCSALESIAIPDPVSKLNDRVFSGCTSLHAITLPGSVREISSNTFEGCTSLSKIYAVNPIPAVIESSTFSTAYEGGSIYVPEGSTGIYWIHPYWGKFKNIETWDSGTTESFAIGEVTYHITSEADATVEISAANIASGNTRAAGQVLEIPSTVTFDGKEYRVAGIANDGFAGAQISELTLPATVSYVGLGAFKGCSALTSLTCLATLPPSVNVSSFDEATYAAAELSVPESAVSAYEENEVWKKFQITGIPTVINATSIELNQPEAEVFEGENIKLTATITPAETTDQTVTWTSSDETVAVVDAFGSVSALKAGTTTITAKTANGLEASCTVTVLAKVIEAEGIELNQPKAEVFEGETVQLTATVIGSDNQSVKWSSSDENIATVDQNGLVTGVQTGVATIAAETTNGLKATCEVTVVAKVIGGIEADGISLDVTEKTIKEEETLQLTATVTPADATDKTMTWSSSDETVATVDQTGLVTALKAGKATITAETANGLKATCVLTVETKTGVDGVEADAQISVVARDGVIVVTAPDGLEVEVYSLTGMRVAKTREHRVEGLSKGVYIVTVSGKAFKVIVR